MNSPEFSQTKIFKYKWHQHQISRFQIQLTLCDVSFLIKCIVSSIKWLRFAPAHSNPISQNNHNILTLTTESSSDWKCSDSFLMASSTSDSWNCRQSEIRNNSWRASSLDLHFSNSPTKAAAELPMSGFLARWSFLEGGPSWKKENTTIYCITISQNIILWATLIKDRIQLPGMIYCTLLMLSSLILQPLCLQFSILY